MGTSFWILELGDVGVVLIDVLEDVVGEVSVVVRSFDALGLIVSLVFDGSLHQELDEVLFLHFEILFWLLRAHLVCRNLVERSTHQSADHFLLEIIHDLILVLVSVGPDVLETDKLGNQHIVDALDVVRDFHIDKRRIGVFLDVDWPEEDGLKLGLKNLWSFVSL
jgi:hypothetical protein